MTSSEPLKLLHLIHSLELGGAQKVISSLARHHDRDRFIPVVGSLRRAGSLESLMRSAGAEVVYFDKKSPYDIACALRLRRYIIDEKISLVNAHNFSASFWGRIACAGLADVAFVMTEHGRTGQPPMKLNIFNRLFAPGVDAIIAVSEETCDFIKKKYPYNAGKVRLVVNGVDIPETTGWTKERLRGEFGIDETRPVVVNIGALTEVKNQVVLIEAVSILKKKRGEITLLIIGDGPLRKPLRERAGRLGVADNIIFAGERMDGPEILSACDVLCLTSKAEGTSIAALEAMARSCPVVLSSAGGNTRIIEREADGLIIPEDDPYAIASALERILNDRELGRRFAENAKVKIASEFSAERMTRETELVFSETLAGLGIGQ